MEKIDDILAIFILFVTSLYPDLSKTLAAVLNYFNMHLRSGKRVQNSHYLKNRPHLGILLIFNIKKNATQKDDL